MRGPFVGTAHRAQHSADAAGNPLSPRWRRPFVRDDRAVLEVRRPDDDELCGFVAERHGRWQSIAVFGGVLRLHDTEADAIRDVLEAGLTSLADRWTLVDVLSGEEQVVCVQEASPSSVTVALDYYSLPGVPTITLTRRDLADGRWRLRHGEQPGRAAG
jgi:hypothetical protein